jgi:hypothetical protein
MLIKKYTAVGDRVYCNGQAVCSVWHLDAEMPSKERLPNESWLDMRNRTEPIREEERQKRYLRAQIIAKALNESGV